MVWLVNPGTDFKHFYSDWSRCSTRAELWKISFERAVSDLAELGAPAGLAYELTFNKFTNVGWIF